MRLDEVIRGIAITDRRGLFDGEVKGISADSRGVRPGELFVAVRGFEADGHDFILDALEKGATTVMGEAWPEAADEVAKPTVVLVPDTRRALALAAANFYGQPSRKLLVAGVTGTNGKTTVTYILESIIRAASKKVGVLGSVEARYPGRTVPLAHTTPDAVTLQRLLAEMVDAGVSHVAMEVSSHALDQQRVAGVHFKVAGFTNLTQDHLDYHADEQAYFETKARLFTERLRRSRARGRMAVINIDDPRGTALVKLWGGKSLKVSLHPDRGAEVMALETHFDLDGTRATVQTSKGRWEIRSSLVGEHNLSNILVGMGMALAMGFSKQRILRGLEALEAVPGRLQHVVTSSDKKVLVDYAHTPDALEKTLSVLRSLVSGRVMVVFGCGGDRDQSKRFPMGEVVGRLADVAVVTNDNPRTEDPGRIARSVVEGLTAAGMSERPFGEPKSCRVELDRRSAIRLAIESATKDDVVLIAGKGHENYQIVGKQRSPFDDREEARRLLEGLPPPAPVSPGEPTMEVEAGQVEESLEVVSRGEIVEASRSEAVESVEVVEQVDVEPEIGTGETDSARGGNASVGHRAETGASGEGGLDPGAVGSEKS